MGDDINMVGWTFYQQICVSGCPSKNYEWFSHSVPADDYTDIICKYDVDVSTTSKVVNI